MKRSEQTGLSPGLPVTLKMANVEYYIEAIICLVIAPELKGHCARCYGLAAQDEVHINEKLPAFT